MKGKVMQTEKAADKGSLTRNKCILIHLFSQKFHIPTIYNFVVVKP